MIRLKSCEQALAMIDELPPLAVLRIEQLEGTDGKYDPDAHGYLIILEENDDPFNISEIGSDPYFEVVTRERERDGSYTYEATIAIDEEKMVGIIWRETTILPQSFQDLIQEYLEE